ncbi:hypothetical protein SCHPADRAFT_545588 [Schizopora paradoxa]|uniref:Uncharacterized protein n=1 Tax=Schizopora paradoxa TaxID=27342 RepID=A0A0H2RE99_9AGAM|nr:hypothetical protein SCHPADRAFT_545588 [Schizopora paradoxa]
MVDVVESKGCSAVCARCTMKVWKSHVFASAKRPPAGPLRTERRAQCPPILRTAVDLMMGARGDDRPVPPAHPRDIHQARPGLSVYELDLGTMRGIHGHEASTLADICRPQEASAASNWEKADGEHVGVAHSLSCVIAGPCDGLAFPDGLATDGKTSAG